MGGNAKYRSHTAVIRNTNSESGVQAMRDSSGNLIRIPESERVVGRGNRTGANRANARERMLNNQALSQVRAIARQVRRVNQDANNLLWNPDIAEEYRNNITNLSNLASELIIVKV